MRKSASLVVCFRGMTKGWLVVALAAASPTLGALRFVHSPLPFRLVSSASLTRYAPEAMPGGLALFDYDGDGDLDIFFTNGAELPSARKTEPEPKPP